AALRWSYSCIETYQTPGAAFRGMYADFLDQAADVTERPGLKPIDAQYRHLAELWRTCAHEFLPDSSKPLKKLRDLIGKRKQIFKAKGDAGVPQVAKIVAEMEALEGGFRTDPPLTSGD